MSVCKAVLTIECRLTCGPIPTPLGNETVAREHVYPGNEFGPAMTPLQHCVELE